MDFQGITVLVFKSPLFYLIMAPKCKSSDAGSLGMPKRSRQVFPFSEKTKVLNLVRKEQKSYAAVTKICSKNESSIHEIMTKEEEIRVLLSHLKLQKLQPQHVISA